MRVPVLLSSLALVVLAGRATAAPPPTSSSVPASALVRYQTRLADDAFRTFTPEVSGTVAHALAARSLELWAALTVYEWQGMLLRFAPALENATKVVVRRAEVIRAEERVSDPFASLVFQSATVHALQGGLSRVVASLGVEERRPSPSLAPRFDAPAVRPSPSPPPTPPALSPAAAPRATYPPASRVPAAPPSPMRGAAVPGTSAPRREAPAISPAALAAYTTALAQETARILSHELDGGLPGVLAGKRTEMRAARTVAEWQAMLMSASPRLAASGNVLQRRTEVLRTQSRVVDAYESSATQQAAVAGLQAGLERILAQFGK